MSNARIVQQQDELEEAQLQRRTETVLAGVGTKLCNSMELPEVW